MTSTNTNNNVNNNSDEILNPVFTLIDNILTPSKKNKLILTNQMIKRNLFKDIEKLCFFFMQYNIIIQRSLFMLPFIVYPIMYKYINESLLNIGNSLLIIFKEFIYLFNVMSYALLINLTIVYSYIIIKKWYINKNNNSESNIMLNNLLNDKLKGLNQLLDDNFKSLISKEDDEDNNNYNDCEDNEDRQDNNEDSQDNNDRKDSEEDNNEKEINYLH